MENTNSLWKLNRPPASNVNVGPMTPTPANLALAGSMSNRRVCFIRLIAIYHSASCRCHDNRYPAGVVGHFQRIPTVPFVIASPVLGQTSYGDGDRREIVIIWASTFNVITFNIVTILYIRYNYRLCQQIAPNHNLVTHTSNCYGSQHVLCMHARVHAISPTLHS